jgi:hypothetical protein
MPDSKRAACPNSQMLPCSTEQTTQHTETSKCLRMQVGAPYLSRNEAIYMHDISAIVIDSAFIALRFIEVGNGGGTVALNTNAIDVARPLASRASEASRNSISGRLPAGCRHWLFLLRIGNCASWYDDRPVRRPGTDAADQGAARSGSLTHFLPARNVADEGVIRPGRRLCGRDTLPAPRVRDP